eukprot:356360-Chlamydomonas_euryale.AAC.2
MAGLLRSMGRGCLNPGLNARVGAVPKSPNHPFCDLRIQVHNLAALLLVRPRAFCPRVDAPITATMRPGSP